MLSAFSTANLSHTASSLFDGLWDGKTSSWIALGAVAAVLLGMHVAHKYFGWKPPTRKERRAARERRKIVLFKYERD